MGNRGPNKLSLGEMKQKWDMKHPGILAMFGVQSDSEIGRKYKLTRARVHQMRSCLGIPAVPRSKLSDEVLQLLKTTPVVELAERTGINYDLLRNTALRKGIKPINSASRVENLIEPQKHLLGKISDIKFAKLVGLKPNQILNYRHKHGIETSILSPRHKDFVRTSREKLKELYQIGYTNAQIAKELGISTSYTRTLTKEVGIERKSSRPKREPFYPYPTWLNGERHVLQKGQDFYCRPGNIRWKLKQLIKQGNLQLKVCVSRSTVIVEPLITTNSVAP